MRCYRTHREVKQKSQAPVTELGIFCWNGSESRPVFRPRGVSEICKITELEGYSYIIPSMPPTPQEVPDEVVQRSMAKYFQVFAMQFHRSDSLKTGIDKYPCVSKMAHFGPPLFASQKNAHLLPTHENGRGIRDHS